MQATKVSSTALRLLCEWVCEQPTTYNVCFAEITTSWALTSHVVEGSGYLGHQIVGLLEANIHETLVDLQGFFVQLQLQVDMGQEQWTHPVGRQWQGHKLKYTGTSQS